MILNHSKHKWKTIGHHKPKEFLLNAVEKDNLAHVYLLVGEANTGKTTFAKDAAAMLLANSSDLRINPDFYEIDTKQEIKTDDIRGLLSRFALSSVAGGRKVAVIANVQNATIESLNALLKLLEEPKGNAVFFLTATHTGALPETITSRTQKLFFAQAEDKEVLEAIKKFKLSADAKKNIVDLACGKIGVAIRLSENEEELEEFLLQARTAEKFVQAPLFERMAIATELAAKETGEIKNYLQNWIFRLYRKLANTDTQEAKKIYLLINSIETALSRLSRNANRKIVLDSLAISL